MRSFVLRSAGGVCSSHCTVLSICTHRNFVLIVRSMLVCFREIPPLSVVTNYIREKHREKWDFEVNRCKYDKQTIHTQKSQQHSSSSSHLFDATSATTVVVTLQLSHCGRRAGDINERWGSPHGRRARGANERWRSPDRRLRAFLECCYWRVDRFISAFPTPLYTSKHGKHPIKQQYEATPLTVSSYVGATGLNA